ncbi:MAG: dockerin type I domain-containing protein [Pirellulales bacterium]
MKRILLTVGAIALLWIGSGRVWADVAGAPRPYLAGDTNLDGNVDIFDVAAIQPNYGATHGMTWATGDFDRDGDVDIFDIAMMQTNYGATSQFEQAPDVMTNPEPSTLVLWGGLIGIAAGTGWWRSRKRT